MRLLLIFTALGILSGSAYARQGYYVDSEVLSDIKKKEEALSKKEKELMERERELADRERVLGEEFKKLDDLRKEISKKKGINKKENEAKVAKLVETVEKMSPKNAAKLLSTMDENLAVSAMAKINTARLAKIMNNIPPGKLSGLAEIMALGKKLSRMPAQTAKGGRK